MEEPKYLKSTQTSLAYRINQIYYGEVHFVYAAPDGSGAAVCSPLEANPPSSDPMDIYTRLLREIGTNDSGGELIGKNKIGLRKGVQVKLDSEIINEIQRREILQMVEKANVRDFRPVMYTMLCTEVEYLLEPVPIDVKANVASREFMIKELPRDLFRID